MLLDCRTLDLSYVPVPPDVAVVVMDTGVRRRLSGTEYNDRRQACEQAVERIRTIAPGVRALRDVPPELLHEAEASLDPVVLRRARHVVEENRRPADMARALGARDFAAAGALMNESHASLRDLYEVSSVHLDLICEAARFHPACFGARMTGAGFGGCAIALVRSDGVDDFIRHVQPQYEARTYKGSDFFVADADEGARLDPL
jgi:galactokinase